MAAAAQKKNGLNATANPGNAMGIASLKLIGTGQIKRVRAS